MKALIDNIKFKSEWESKFGTMYNHLVSYYDQDEKIVTAFYSSKKKEQTYFKPGQEAEFTIEEKQGKNNSTFNVIKPVKSGNFSGYSKNLKREQSKYSGFAVSYAKDLVVSDKLKFSDMLPAAEKMFKFMVDLDKSIE